MKKYDITGSDEDAYEAESEKEERKDELDQALESIGKDDGCLRHRHAAEAEDGMVADEPAAHPSTITTHWQKNFSIRPTRFSASRLLISCSPEPTIS